jgi:DNA-binding NarL/FixJ family response regulator
VVIRNPFSVRHWQIGRRRLHTPEATNGLWPPPEGEGRVSGQANARRTHRIDLRELSCRGARRGAQLHPVPRARASASQIVLVADDDDGIRSLLTEVFDAEGYAVLAAAAGDAALALAHRQPPSAAVLDVAMPGLSGYEVCHRLRADFGADLGIVIISGVRMESYDRIAGLLLGADDFLVKPFDPSELLARVRRLLERVVSAPSFHQLTPRELEILTLMAEGYAQHDIATRLVISPKTAASHIQHIIEKLGVHSRAQAVAMAYRYGVVASSS